MRALFPRARLVTVRGASHWVHTDDPDGRFVPGTAFTTEAVPGSGVPRELVLRSARLHNGIWLLAFDGIPDRTGAEGLRGTRLFVAADDADDDAADEGWYEEELVGLRAVGPDYRAVRQEPGSSVFVDFRIVSPHDRFATAL